MKLPIIVLSRTDLESRLKDEEYIFSCDVSKGCKWFAFGRISLLKELLGIEEDSTDDDPENQVFAVRGRDMK